MPSELAPLPGTLPADSRVIDVCLEYLLAESVEVVFGIPGGLLHPFFEAVEHHEELELVVTRHEEGAAFMADGFARLNGQLAVCAGTSGPGATNLLTGVACAYADGVPMLVITGQAAGPAIGKGAAQETGREDMDIVQMFRPVTKYSAMVTAPGHFAGHLRRALRRALSGRPGPVHLNVPVDLWEMPLEEAWFQPETYRSTTNAFDRLQVQRAAEVLLNAKHPAVLVGSGIVSSKATEHVRTLVELLGARTATTPRAKGDFPEDHPLSQGVFGFAGHRGARELMLGEEVDVLLVAGASLNETTTLNWNPALRPSEALLHLDIDPDRIGRTYPVEIPLVGDAQAILVELVYHLHRAIREGGRPASEWPDPVPFDESERFTDLELRHSEAMPLTPQRWRHDLEEVLPFNAVVFSDIGGHMLFNIHHLCIRESQRFVLNLGFGSMGHGTAAPIGAKLADPQRPILAIIGDGCFTMNGMELLTAVEKQIPVIWIVENNQMHGITWHGSQQVGQRRPLDSVRYRRKLDVAGIARAMGLEAWVVEEPGGMQDAIETALKARGPTLIEVRIDGSISPPLGDRAKSIAGFTKK